jgi:hypothetical protein
MIFTSYANLLNASVVFKANGLPNTTKPFYFEVDERELAKTPKAIADILHDKLEAYVRDGTAAGEEAWGTVLTAITDPLQRTMCNVGSWHMAFIHTMEKARV